jgi:hypothetical protein
MAKGLSRLQTEILKVLEEWPSFKEAEPGSFQSWAKPQDIIAALHKPKTPATRATISRALARLHKRGVIAKASPGQAIADKSFCYVRITYPKND